MESEGSYRLEFNYNEALKDVKNSIKNIKLTIAPFFLFENSDICIDTKGWKLNRDLTTTVVE